MALQTTDEIIVKAEIRAGLFKKAFEELALEMARRDLKALDAAARRIRPMLDGFSIGHIRPPNNSTATADQIREYQRIGHEEAIDEFEMVARRISKRLGQ